MAGEVRLMGRLICASEAEAEIVRLHLPEHVSLTRAERGCLSFHVEATDDPLVWRVEEAFADRDAFLHHQARTGASRWGAVTQGIRRAYSVQGLE